MIEFMLGVVQAVLAALVMDLLSGRRRWVERAEVERALQDEAGQAVLTDMEMKILVGAAMDEIDGMVTQPGQIKWERRRLVAAAPAVEEPPQFAIMQELARLDFLVLERTRQLRAVRRHTADGGELTWEILAARQRPEFRVI